MEEESRREDVSKQEFDLLSIHRFGLLYQVQPKVMHVTVNGYIMFHL